jgi:hypothetical protein
MSIHLSEQLAEFYGPVTRAEVVSGSSPLPALSGVYLWFFRSWPAGVPVGDCVVTDGARLLYVGISPDKRSKPNSRQNLRNRVRYHLTGNAEGSTLRRTLGVLLAAESGFPLRRVGSGRRMTLTHLGEQWLDNWLDENALIFWQPDPAPWLVEHQLLQLFSCPLNMQGNQHHPFCASLRELRATALAEARSSAVANEGNQRRRVP